MRHLVTRHPAARALALTLIAVLAALCFVALTSAHAQAGEPGDVTSQVSVVEHALTLGIEDRQPAAPATSFTVGDRVSAWLQIANPGEDTTVELVWIHDGKPRWQIALDVGHSTRGWRTWAHKTLRKGDAGRWTVEVHDAHGQLIDTLDFDVAPAPVADQS